MADKSEVSLDGRPLHSLRVVDLRTALTNRGLPNSGTKKILVERLRLQLKLEKIQQQSVAIEGRVPNLGLQDELPAQNDFVRQYLLEQQRTYAMQLEARRLAEEEKAESEKCPTDAQQIPSRDGEHRAEALAPAGTCGDPKRAQRESWERRRSRHCPPSVDPGGEPPILAEDPAEARKTRLALRLSKEPSPPQSIKLTLHLSTPKEPGDCVPEHSVKKSAKKQATLKSPEVGHEAPSEGAVLQRSSPRKGAVAPSVNQRYSMRHRLFYEEHEDNPPVGRQTGEEVGVVVFDTAQQPVKSETKWYEPESTSTKTGKQSEQTPPKTTLEKRGCGEVHLHKDMGEDAKMEHPVAKDGSETSVKPNEICTEEPAVISPTPTRDSCVTGVTDKTDANLEVLQLDSDGTEIASDEEGPLSVSSDSFSVADDICTVQNSSDPKSNRLTVGPEQVPFVQQSTTTSLFRSPAGSTNTAAVENLPLATQSTDSVKESTENKTQILLQQCPPHMTAEHLVPVPENNDDVDSLHSPPVTNVSSGRQGDVTESTVAERVPTEISVKTTGEAVDDVPVSIDHVVQSNEPHQAVCLQKTRINSLDNHGEKQCCTAPNVLAEARTRRPLTTEEMTSAVQSILDSSENDTPNTFQLSNCPSEPSTHLYDDREIASATDSLLQEMCPTEEDFVHGVLPLEDTEMPQEELVAPGEGTPTKLHDASAGTSSSTSHINEAVNMPDASCLTDKQLKGFPPLQQTEIDIYSDSALTSLKQDTIGSPTRGAVLLCTNIKDLERIHTDVGHYHRTSADDVKLPSDATTTPQCQPAALQHCVEVESTPGPGRNNREEAQGIKEISDGTELHDNCGTAGPRIGTDRSLQLCLDIRDQSRARILSKETLDSTRGLHENNEEKDVGVHVSPQCNSNKADLPQIATCDNEQDPPYAQRERDCHERAIGDDGVDTADQKRHLQRKQSDDKQTNVSVTVQDENHLHTNSKTNDSSRSGDTVHAHGETAQQSTRLERNDATVSPSDIPWTPTIDNLGVMCSHGTHVMSPAHGITGNAESTEHGGHKLRGCSPEHSDTLKKTSSTDADAEDLITVRRDLHQEKHDVDTKAFEIQMSAHCVASYREKLTEETPVSHPADTLDRHTLTGLQPFPESVPGSEDSPPQADNFSPVAKMSRMHIEKVDGGVPATEDGAKAARELQLRPQEVGHPNAFGQLPEANDIHKPAESTDPVRGTDISKQAPSVDESTAEIEESQRHEGSLAKANVSEQFKEHSHQAVPITTHQHTVEAAGSFRCSTEYTLEHPLPLCKSQFKTPDTEVAMSTSVQSPSNMAYTAAEAGPFEDDKSNSESCLKQATETSRAPPAALREELSKQHSEQTSLEGREHMLLETQWHDLSTVSKEAGAVAQQQEATKQQSKGDPGTAPSKPQSRIAHKLVEGRTAMSTAQCTSEVVGSLPHPPLEALTKEGPYISMHQVRASCPLSIKTEFTEADTGGVPTPMQTAVPARESSYQNVPKIKICQTDCLKSLRSPTLSEQDLSVPQYAEKSDISLLARSTSGNEGPTTFFAAVEVPQHFDKTACDSAADEKGDARQYDTDDSMEVDVEYVAPDDDTMTVTTPTRPPEVKAQEDESSALLVSDGGKSDRFFLHHQVQEAQYSLNKATEDTTPSLGLASSEADISSYLEASSKELLGVKEPASDAHCTTQRETNDEMKHTYNECTKEMIQKAKEVPTATHTGGQDVACDILEQSDKTVPSLSNTKEVCINSEVQDGAEDRIHPILVSSEHDQLDEKQSESLSRAPGLGLCIVESRRELEIKANSEESSGASMQVEPSESHSCSTDEAVRGGGTNTTAVAGRDEDAQSQTTVAHNAGTENLEHAIPNERDTMKDMPEWKGTSHLAPAVSVPSPAIPTQLGHLPLEITEAKNSEELQLGSETVAKTVNAQHEDLQETEATKNTTDLPALDCSKFVRSFEISHGHTSDVSDPKVSQTASGTINTHTSSELEGDFPSKAKSSVTGHEEDEVYKNDASSKVMASPADNHAVRERNETEFCVQEIGAMRVPETYGPYEKSDLPEKEAAEDTPNAPPDQRRLHQNYTHDSSHETLHIPIFSSASVLNEESKDLVQGVALSSLPESSSAHATQPTTDNDCWTYYHGHRSHNTGANVHGEKHLTKVSLQAYTTEALVKMTDISIRLQNTTSLPASSGRTPALGTCETSEIAIWSPACIRRVIALSTEQSNPCESPPRVGHEDCGHSKAPETDHAVEFSAAIRDTDKLELLGSEALASTKRREEPVCAEGGEDDKNALVVDQGYGCDTSRLGHHYQESKREDMARLRGHGTRRQASKDAKVAKDSPAKDLSEDSEQDSKSKRLRNGRRSAEDAVTEEGEKGSAPRRSIRQRTSAKGAGDMPDEGSSSSSSCSSSSSSDTEESAPVKRGSGDYSSCEQESPTKESKGSPSREESPESEDESDKSPKHQTGRLSAASRCLAEKEPTTLTYGSSSREVSPSPQSQNAEEADGSPTKRPRTKEEQDEECASSDEKVEALKAEEQDLLLDIKSEDAVAEPSSATDIEMKEEPSSASSPPRFKARRISTTAIKKENDSKDSEEKPQQQPRKRRWGSTNVVVGPSLSISTNALKTLIPDLDASPVKVKAEPAAMEEGETDDAEAPAAQEQEETPPEPSSKAAVETPAEEGKSAGSLERRKPITLEKTTIHKRSVISPPPASPKDEDHSRKQPSPARNPKSRTLFVRNLVRPFTLNQLKQLLKEFGDTEDSEFWIDKIKSKCFVTYVSEEDAVKAREALHHLRWPLCNPKILHVDFATPEEVARQKEPPPPPAPAPAPLPLRSVPPAERAPVTYPVRTVEIDRSTLQPPSRPGREEAGPPVHRLRTDSARRPASRETRASPPSARARGQQPVREWDRDKVVQESPERAPQSSPKRERQRSAERKERREKKGAKRKQEEDTPAKLLDDLFRKTKASPCIYWLPLTEEQITQREEERRQRQLERERRRQQQQEEEERRRKGTGREAQSRQRERDSRRSTSRSPVRRR